MFKFTDELVCHCLIKNDQTVCFLLLLHRLLRLILASSATGRVSVSFVRPAPSILFTSPSKKLITFNHFVYKSIV